MADTDALNADDAPSATKPRARTSTLTVVLIVLNLLAVLGFGALLWTDFSKRQEWALAIFMRDLAIMGLPLSEKDSPTNVSAGMQPTFDLDPPIIRDAYKARGGSANEKFLAIHENFRMDIRFADLETSPNLVTKAFADAGASDPNPPFSLKQDLDRVKNKLPGEIEGVAQKVAENAKNAKAAEKRALLKRILFPMCVEAWQVVNLNTKIEKTPDNGLDDFIKDAAARRMWHDILQPLEVFRPSEAVGPPSDFKEGDPKLAKLLVDRVAEVALVKDKDKGPTAYKSVVDLNQLAELFQKRCADVMADSDWIHPNIKRDASEKRRAVAFLLVAVSQVEEPGADRVGAAQPKDPAAKVNPGDQAGAGPNRVLAFPRAEDRAAVVCGLRDFNQACEDLTLVFEIMEKQTIEAIERDRGQFVYPLTVRIADPAKFTAALVGVMEKMHIAIPDVKGFSQSLSDRLKEMQSKGGEQGIRLASTEDTEVLLGELQRVMDAHQVVIPSTPSLEINKGAFEREVYALLNANAVGFIGKYNLALKRLQDLSVLLQRREQHSLELKELQDLHASMLKTRLEHETVLKDRLKEARVETRNLAVMLEELQQELFQAQVDLYGAHEYNQYLQKRLREQETQRANTKEGKGQ